MLKDDDIKATTTRSGEGNSYSTLYRGYNSRFGRWFSLDPLAAEFAWSSPYVGMGGNPVIMIDPLGDAWFQNNKTGSLHHDSEMGEDYAENLGDDWDYLGPNNMFAEITGNLDLNDKGVLDRMALQGVPVESQVDIYEIPSLLGKKTFEKTDFKATIPDGIAKDFMASVGFGYEKKEYSTKTKYVEQNFSDASGLVSLSSEEVVPLKTISSQYIHSSQRLIEKKVVNSKSLVDKTINTLGVFGSISTKEEIRLDIYSKTIDEKLNHTFDQVYKNIPIMMQFYELIQNMGKSK